MTQPPWKLHLAVAALVLAPVLTGGGTAFAMPADGAPPAAADVQKATAFFTKGAELFKAKKYVPALDQFKQSYALLPSPNSHLYIARCLAALGERRAAWLELDRTATEARGAGPKYARVPDAALQERDELAPRLAIVTVVVQNADPAASVRVGALDLPPDHWGKPYPVEPGTLDVVVQAPGRPPVKQTITIALGEQREVRLDAGAGGGPVVVGPGQGAPAPRSGPSPLRIGAFVAGGVGVAGFVMLAVGGALSNATYSDVNALCKGQQGCPGGNRATVDDKISSGKTQQAVANAGLVLGVVGVATGATLFVLSMRKKPPSDAGQPSADLVVGPGWVGAKGSF
jgi:hypothetical protein